MRTVSLGVGTLASPNMPLSTAMQRPTMTSSETFSMIAAASPATRASRTGALERRYKHSVHLHLVSPCIGSSAGGDASHMAKEVAVDVPKSSVKAQDHLENIEIEMLQRDLVQRAKN